MLPKIKNLSLIWMNNFAPCVKGKGQIIFMTDQIKENQAEPEKTNDKEINFRKLEESFQRQLAQERAARIEAEKRASEYESKKNVIEDDDDSEPYVDHKKLTKKLDLFERNLDKKIDQRAEEKARTMIHENKKESWLKNNPDFYDVLQLADKFAQHDPELAESILEMPDTFERQKLVYKNIKALGINKPQVKQQSIQEKIDMNKRSPYYQPSGVGTSPYASQGDFSASGQKNAYDKMLELKRNLRL